eukprot:gene10913-12072_t
MSALIRRSCNGVFFGASGIQFRSKARPLLAACSRKTIDLGNNNDRAIIHTSANLSAALTRGKNYTKHWFNERAVAIGLLGCVPVAMAFPGAPVDYALGVLIPFHNYWGLHHIILDYVPRGIPLKAVEYLSMGALAVQLAGFAYINYKDVGICKLIALTLSL